MKINKVNKAKINTHAVKTASNNHSPYVIKLTVLSTAGKSQEKTYDNAWYNNQSPGNKRQAAVV